MTMPIGTRVTHPDRTVEGTVVPNHPDGAWTPNECVTTPPAPNMVQVVWDGEHNHYWEYTLELQWHAPDCDGSSCDSCGYIAGDGLWYPGPCPPEDLPYQQDRAEGTAGSEVWVLDFEANGPEGGDYDGWQSVHATKLSAIRRIITKLAEHGVGFADLKSGESGTLVTAHNRADNGSEAVDLLLPDGTEIGYGVHRMPVEP